MAISRKKFKGAGRDADDFMEADSDSGGGSESENDSDIGEVLQGVSVVLLAFRSLGESRRYLVLNLAVESYAGMITIMQGKRRLRGCLRGRGGAGGGHR